MTTSTLAQCLSILLKNKSIQTRDVTIVVDNAIIPSETLVSSLSSSCPTNRDAGDDDMDSENDECDFPRRTMKLHGGSLSFYQHHSKLSRWDTSDRSEKSISLVCPARSPESLGKVVRNNDFPESLRRAPRSAIKPKPLKKHHHFAGIIVNAISIGTQLPPMLLASPLSMKKESSAT